MVAAKQINFLLFTGLLATVSSLSLATTATECQPDMSSSFCKADCGDAGLLDISTVFEYPVMTSSTDYVYHFSPCTGVPCVGENPALIVQAVLCQVSIRDRDNYTCAVLGKTTWTVEQTKPYVFTVKFSGGSDGRTTTVTFREDATMDTTEIKYIDESPKNNYNLEVTGKHVGQPTQAPEDQCVVDTANPCVAKCADTTFDISNVFKYPARTQAGSSAYLFSPCGGTSCGGEDSAAVCQRFDIYNYSCGSVSSMKWWLNQTKPFYQFTIEYSDGNTGRKSVFSFVEDVKMFTTALALLSELPELHYNFEVRGRNIGQPGGPTEQCMVDPDKPWVLKCNGSVAVDISDVFKYPAEDSTSSVPKRYYYNPINGASCGCHGNVTSDNNAVCQDEPHLTYRCGLLSNTTWKLSQAHPLMFSITYKGGDHDCESGIVEGQSTSRSSIVSFYEDTSSTLPAKFTFIEENPKLYYQFEVKGSYVGQKINKSVCVVAADNPCMAVCNETTKLDISKVFPSPMTIVGEGGDNFIFSPCSGFTCNDKNSSVCMVSDDGSSIYSCGILNTAKWTIRQSKPFYIFLITYTGGDALGAAERHSTFTFIQNSDVPKTVSVYSGVQDENFLFDIVGSCVGQPDCNIESSVTGIGAFTFNEIVYMTIFFGAILLSVAIGIAAFVVVKLSVGSKLATDLNSYEKIPLLTN